MKKSIIAIFLVIVIILFIVLTIFTMQLKNMQNVKKNYDEEMQYFLEFEDKQFAVNDFISIMNRAIENNYQYNVKLDENNLYIDDDKYSIKVFLQLDDREELIPMETLILSENGGPEKISKLFADIVYRYDSIEYHKSTGRIKKIIIYGFTKRLETPFSPYNK